MTATNLPIDKFHHGETIIIDIACRNRASEGQAATPLSDPLLQTVTFKVAAERGGDAILIKVATLSDAQTSTFLIELSAAEYTSILAEGVTYFYQVDSRKSGEDPIQQAHGILVPQYFIGA